MPEPVKRGQRYMPGLDGLRAIAVLGVIAYHLGFGWAQLVVDRPRRLLLRPLRGAVTTRAGAEWVEIRG